jgi:hypothetical protein
LGGICRRHLQDGRIGHARKHQESVGKQVLLPSTLKMEAALFFKLPVDFQRTTRHYVPENGTLHNHSCDNLKSYINHKHGESEELGSYV